MLTQPYSMLEFMHVAADKHCPLQQSNTHPSLLQCAMLPAGNRNVMQVADGECLIQERKGTEGFLLVITTQVQDDCSIYCTFTEPAIYLVVALQHACMVTLPDGTERTIQEHAIAILYSPGATYRFHFQKDTLHEIIVIGYPFTVMDQLSSGYKLLSPFLQQIPSTQTIFLHAINRMASKSLLISIRMLMNKTYVGGNGVYEIFFEARSRDILIEALDKFAEPPPDPQQVLNKQQDFETIHEIKKEIDQRPDRRPTLSELAKQAGWNKDKLSKGFRQVYNISVMEYFHQVQMEEAKKLVERTDLSIQEISSALGLLSQNFTRSFSAYFGTTPLHFRQQYLRKHSN